MSGDPTVEPWQEPGLLAEQVAKNHHAPIQSMKSETVLTFTQSGHYFCDGLKDAALALANHGALVQSGCETCPRFSSCGLSHWTSIQTQIKDIEALQLACAEMGVQLESASSARGYNGQMRPADYVIRLKGPYDVAVHNQSNGTFQLVTDWFCGHVEKEVGKNFGKLLQLYGVHKAAAEARRKGYLVQRRTGKGGSIQLVVTGL